MNDKAIPYLVTATDGRGVRDTFARDAVSVEALRELLERDGYTDIEFIDDDISAQIRQRRPAYLRPSTPADYRREARMRAPGAKRLSWLFIVRHNFVLLASLFALGVYGAVRHSMWLSAVAAALIAGWVVLTKRARGRSDDYADLIRAGARGDRATEAQLIERLLAQRALPDAARADVTFRRIRLRARAGDLAGALAELAQHHAAQALSPGLYENRVASLHYAAGEMTGCLLGMERAYIASGETATHRLDLAFSHARFGDPRRAATLLGTIDRRNLSPLHRAIPVAIDGLLARSEGDDATAARLLGEAVTTFSAFQDKPATWPIMGILRGYHALSLVRTGHMAEARATLDGWGDVARSSLDPEARAALDDAMGPVRA